MSRHPHGYARARALFRATFKGQANPLTPDVLSYGMHGKDLAWELSQGEGIRTRPNGEPCALFAVTVLQDKGGPQGQSRGDLNRAFPDRESAIAYILDGFRLPTDTELLAIMQEEIERYGLD